MSAPSNSILAVDATKRIRDQRSKFSVQMEPQTTVGVDGLDKLPSWVEGNVRIDSAIGGFKFCRSTQYPASAAEPAFMFSTYRTDQSSRGRCEISFSAPLPRRQPLWIAASVYFEFEIGEGPEHVTFLQLYHGAPGATLNPAMALTLYRDYISLAIWDSQKVGVTEADQRLVSHKMPGLTAALRGRWFDVAAKVVLSPNPNDAGYLDLYLDGVLVVEHRGPIGMQGPAANGKVTAEWLRAGAYAGESTSWTPDFPRDVWIRKLCAAPDDEYTVGMVSAW